MLLEYERQGLKRHVAAQQVAVQPVCEIRDPPVQLPSRMLLEYERQGLQRHVAARHVPAKRVCRSGKTSLCKLLQYE